MNAEYEPEGDRHDADEARHQRIRAPIDRERLIQLGHTDTLQRKPGVVQLRLARISRACRSRATASLLRPSLRKTFAKSSSVLATSGWAAPRTFCLMANARRYKGSAFSGWPCATHN